MNNPAIKENTVVPPNVPSKGSRRRKNIGYGVFIGLAVLVVALVGIKYFNSQGCGSSNLIRIDTTETDMQRIGRQVAERWLSESKCTYNIRDYTIDDIKFESQHNDQFNYTLAYSSQPTWLHLDYWKALAGRKPNGMVKKTGTMSITKHGRVYTFDQWSAK